MTESERHTAAADWFTLRAESAALWGDDADAAWNRLLAGAADKLAREERAFEDMRVGAAVDAVLARLVPSVTPGARVPGAPSPEDTTGGRGGRGPSPTCRDETRPGEVRPACQARGSAGGARE